LHDIAGIKYIIDNGGLNMSFQRWPEEISVSSLINRDHVQSHVIFVSQG